MNGGDFVCATDLSHRFPITNESCFSQVKANREGGAEPRERRRGCGRDCLGTDHDLESSLFRSLSLTSFTHARTHTRTWPDMTGWVTESYRSLLQQARHCIEIDRAFIYTTWLIKTYIFKTVMVLKWYLKTESKKYEGKKSSSRFYKCNLPKFWHQNESFRRCFKKTHSLRCSLGACSYSSGWQEFSMLY